MSATAIDLEELIALRVLAQGGRLTEPRRSTATRSGGHASRWRGRGVDFRESRVYQAGDDIRHMDWRLTARSGRAHTKVFEEEREQGLLLAVDFNPGMRFGTRKRFKSVQAGRAASLLAWLAAGSGDRVGLVGFGGGIGGEVKPGGGRRGVLRVLRALRDWDAAADVKQASTWSAAMPRIRRLLRPGMRLVVLSDGFDADPAAWSPLAQLAGRHDVAVILLRDALEIAPPPPGRYALSSGGIKQTLDFADPQVRAAWPQRFAAMRERVRAESIRIGVRVIELDTDADLKRTLSPLLARSRVITGGRMNAEGPVLRDIHLPPDPAWWPPAPGWWLLALACLLIGWWCMRRWRTLRGRRRWRKSVFAELDRLVAADAVAPDPARLAGSVSLLLRRASLLIDRRAAALSGEAWLTFLDRHGEGGFVDGPGRVLLDAPFRRSAQIDTAALIVLARSWLERALPKERPDA